MREDRLATFESALLDILAETVSVHDPWQTIRSIHSQCLIRLRQLDDGTVREITYQNVQEMTHGSYLFPGNKEASSSAYGDRRA
jgi:hypothetical protein